MPALASHSTTQTPECPGCQKRWYIGATGAGGLGPMMQQHRCPGCREWWALIYRVYWGEGGILAQLLGIHRSYGRDEGSLRDTLAEVPELTGHEIELIVTVARLLGSAYETRSTQAA